MANSRNYGLNMANSRNYGLNMANSRKYGLNMANTRNYGLNMANSTFLSSRYGELGQFFPTKIPYFGVTKWQKLATNLTPA